MPVKRSADSQKPYLQAMLAAYGWICGILLGVPALLMSIANLSAFGGILMTVASFVLPCLLTGALLCEWAGREISRRKWPAFCMTGLSLLVAVLVLPLLALVLAPRASGLSMDVLRLGLTYVLMMLIFGAGPAALAAVLFIGGVERANNLQGVSS